MIKKLLRSLLVVTWFTLTAASCGSEATTPPSAVRTADGAEVGASVEAREWQVTLIDLPMLMKRASGEAGANTWDTAEPGTDTAAGIWLVCPVRVANTAGELRMFPWKLFVATDEQGRHFSMTNKPAHIIHIWSTERWMSDDHQLIQNTLDVAEFREGPLLFDVSEDSTGLRLTADGIEASIDLGF